MNIRFLKNRILDLKSIFITLLIFSVLVVLLMLFPDTGILQGADMFILWILFATSGLGLVIMTYRRQITGKVKIFLLASGFSAAGFLLGVVLHNLFYALGMLAADLAILNTVLNFLEVSTFLIAIILCPIGLLIGVVGTLILWKRIPAG